MKPTILLVDDEVEEVAPLIGPLRDAGFNVVTARGGREAITLLKTRSIQAVLCDLEMPGVGGYDVLAAVGSDPATQALPFILGNLVWDESNWSKPAGGRTADAHIPKPYTVRDVIGFMSRMLQS